MLTKIAVTAVVFLLVWLIFFRRRARARPDPDRALPHPLHLARCPGCGVYRLPDAPCDCTRKRDAS